MTISAIVTVRLMAFPMPLMVTVFCPCSWNCDRMYPTAACMRPVLVTRISFAGVAACSAADGRGFSTFRYCCASGLRETAAGAVDMARGCSSQERAAATRKEAGGGNGTTTNKERQTTVFESQRGVGKKQHLGKCVNELGEGYFLPPWSNGSGTATGTATTTATDTMLAGDVVAARSQCRKPLLPLLRFSCK